MHHWVSQVNLSGLTLKLIAIFYLFFRVRNGAQIAATTRSHNNLYEISMNTSSSPSSLQNSPTHNMLGYAKSSPLQCSRDAPVSFESMIRETDKSVDSVDGWDIMDEPCCDINDIPEGDIKKLQPVLWLELATLFDKNSVTLDKRKPFKRKRKEEGHVFGVSLNALVRRDQQVTGEDTSLVPLIVQGILDELISRGAKEEGILRIPGNKQKVKNQYSTEPITNYIF